MRKWALGFASVFFVSMISGCMGAGGSLSVAAPVWEAGYSFAYSNHGSYSGAVAMNGESEAESDDWGPVATVFEVLNTTLEANDEPVYLAAFTWADQSEEDGPERMDAPRQTVRTGTVGALVPNVGFVGVRQRDLQSVPAWLEFDSQCTTAGCTQSVAGLQFADAPEWSYLEFPLEKGKKWSADDEFNQGGDGFFGEMDVRFEARVVGRKAITIPLGEVQAVRIDWTVKPVNLDEYKRQVEEEADDSDVNLRDFEIELEVEGSFFYSEEYRNIVKATHSSQYYVEFKAEQEGEEFEFISRGRDTEELVLDGVQLVARSERGLDYVARLATGKARVSDPTGLAPEQVLYGLDVIANKTVVNAAESETIGFQAQLEGVDALPGGHKVAWRMLDASGRGVGNGTGLAYSHAFTQPGEYTVLAEAFDADGELTATSGVTVFANYLKTVDGECPPVVIFSPFGACPEVDVPVRPGIQYLKITADVASPLERVPALSAGRLEVRDPSGTTETDADREGTQYAVEIFMFWEHQIDDEDWTVQFVQSRGVLEQVSYTIDLRYDAIPDTVASLGMSLADELEAWVRAE